VIDDTSFIGEVLPSDGRTYMTPFMPGTTPTPMKPYVCVSTPPSRCLYVLNPSYVQDPNDPTTFPWFQGTGQVHTEVPVVRHSGSTVANMQTSRPQGYHGWPTV
jgi:hypothetical protein